MTLCITRYNNKTLYEMMCYNLKIDRNDNDRNIFKKWNTINIPNLEKEIETKRKNRIIMEDINEKAKLRKQIVYIKKDIHLLKNVQKKYYENLLNNIRKTGVKNWIYNVPISIHSSINNKKIFIFEMNNDSNNINGIAYIQNNLYHRRYNIYTDRNYNRYSYRGRRIDMLNTPLSRYKYELEKILFENSTHQKRGQGIQQISRINLDKIQKEEIIEILEEIFQTNNI